MADHAECDRSDDGCPACREDGCRKMRELMTACGHAKANLVEAEPEQVEERTPITREMALDAGMPEIEGQPNIERRWVEHEPYCSVCRELAQARREQMEEDATAVVEGESLKIDDERIRLLAEFKKLVEKWRDLERPIHDTNCARELEELISRISKE